MAEDKMPDDKMAEDKYYQLNGHSSEQTLGDSEGQGSQTCCSPWDHKELDTTQQLNNVNTLPHAYVEASVQPQNVTIFSDSTFKTVMG